MITQSDPAWKRMEQLAERAFQLAGFPGDFEAEEASEDEFLQDADAIVSHVEINNQHGVGVLLERLFRGRSNAITIRSQDLYGGHQEFGELALRISHSGPARDQCFRNVLAAMKGNSVARILCAPYYPDDARTAIALAEIYAAPLATYIMDDQNISMDAIPDDLMNELFYKSKLVLAISPEMATAYESKYKRSVWLMPPLAPDRLILRQERARSGFSESGVIVGNIWGQQWLDLLRGTVRDSGVTLRWYSNSHFRFLSGNRDSLRQDSIIVPEGSPLSDDDLVRELRDAPFAVVPSGTLNPGDDRRFIARLSLPSRIPLILATSHTPIIVLGDRTTAAAQFVERHGIGLACPYETSAFQDAVATVTKPEVNARMRQNALILAPSYSDTGAADWIWASLAAGQPVDSRYS